MTPGTQQLPEGFRRAVATLHRASVRPEVTVADASAPARLAPFTRALTADVRVDDVDLAAGRLVVLHDPDGQAGWEGTTRMVAYLRAGTDVEIAVDPMLPAVGWSWLVEALTLRGARYAAAGGTVTRAASERFGALSETAGGAEVEIRAAWTPLDEDLSLHVGAWTDLLCTAAGLAPLPPGVVALARRRRP